MLHLFLLGTILCGSNCQIIETCIKVLNYVHNLDWIQAVQNKVWPFSVALCCARLFGGIHVNCNWIGCIRLRVECISVVEN